MQLRGAVAVITGASSGIGRATALRLAGHGTHVVLAARRAAVLDDVAWQCAERGVEALAVPTDTTDEAAVNALARRAVERFGRIDVWINAAAVVSYASFDEMSIPEFRRVMDVGVLGYVYGARAALPVMTAQGRGVLVNVSSTVAALPQPYLHAYSMSKAAVRALGVTLRQELWLSRARGVHVVTVMPSVIDTPIFRVSANHTGRAIRAMPPVYPVDAAARTIVRRIRRPRRESVVGTSGRYLAWQARFTPGLVERTSALFTHHVHLRRAVAPDTAGNLFEPSDDPRYLRTDGRWGGRRKRAQRRLATAALLAATATAGRRAVRASGSATPGARPPRRRPRPCR